MRYLFTLFFCLQLCSCSSKNEKTVLLSVTAKNKEHILPRFLKCIENLDYSKKAITLHILTGCNDDQTEPLLVDWVEKNRSQYRDVLFTTTEEPEFDQDTKSGFHKEAVLKYAKETKSDFCFVVSPVSFLAPQTLKSLIAKDVPIIAPMLRPIPEINDNTTNFFAAVTDHGFFKDDPEYYLIYNQVKTGIFQVPVVHCTYLIRSDAYEKVSYLWESPDFEFLNFGRHARKNQVDQYICNEEDFGVFLHFYGDPSLEEQKKRLQYIFSLPSL